MASQIRMAVIVRAAKKFYSVIVYCKSFYLKDMHTIVQQDSYFTTMQLALSLGHLLHSYIVVQKGGQVTKPSCMVMK